MSLSSDSAGSVDPNELASPEANVDLKTLSSVSRVASLAKFTLSTAVFTVAKRITLSCGGNRLPAWLMRSTISWVTSPTRIEFKICLNSGSLCLKISTSSKISIRSLSQTLASKNHWDLYSISCSLASSSPRAGTGASW